MADRRRIGRGRPDLQGPAGALLRSDPRVASVDDVGVHDDETTTHPHVAVEAARRVAAGAADRALLVCGTGLGVAFSATKVPAPADRRVASERRQRTPARPSSSARSAL